MQKCTSPTSTVYNCAELVLFAWVFVYASRLVPAVLYWQKRHEKGGVHAQDCMMIVRRVDST